MVKKLTKILALIALVFSYLAPVAQVVGAEEVARGNTKVTIHKVKLNDLKDWPKDKNEAENYPGLNGPAYDGHKIKDFHQYFGQGAEELDGVSFFYWQLENYEQYEHMLKFQAQYDTVEKVEQFLATGGRQEPDEPKYSDEDDSQAGYVETPKTANGLGVEIQLEDGYYWFVENQASVLVGEHAGSTLADGRAIPFGLSLPTVNKEGKEVRDLHVYPKNTIVKPRIDKNLASKTEGAQFQEGANYANYLKEKGEITRTVGAEIPYEVKTEVPATSHYKTLRWEDTMTAGLTLTGEITLTAKRQGQDISFEKGKDYTLTSNKSGFVIAFTEVGLKKLEQEVASQAVEFTLTYKAVLNGEAVVDHPEKNQIFFDYGNGPKQFADPRENTVVPNNKTITVRKTWAEGVAPTGVLVTYYLYEKGATSQDDKVVASVEKAGSDFNHTFTDLDDSKAYYVKEMVKGYIPSYVLGQGYVSVTNHKDADNPEPLVPTSPSVVTGGARFQKVDQTTLQGLEGAEFYIKNKDSYLARKSQEQKGQEESNYDAAEREYQRLVKETTTKDNKDALRIAKQARDKAYQAVKTEWTFEKEATKAYVVKSGSNGYFRVTGLAYGEYELVEKTAPKGYAKLTASVKFIVSQGSMNQAYDVNTHPEDKGLILVNNKKVTIPQTGGIGTIIFAVAGASIMGIALYAYFKNNKDEDQLV